MPTKKEVRDVAETFAYSVLGLSVLGALGIFGWQCYTWLRFRHWVSLSALTALQWFEVPWALWPRDWLGLHAVLSWAPLALVLPILGVAVVVGAGVLFEET
jgi:hypothetical protein